MDLVKGFAAYIGVKYTLVYSDFNNVLRDLLGQDVVRKGDEVSLTGHFPVKGDLISTGFTILPWRQKVVLYSAPTFPSQVLLVARADSPLSPIKDSADLSKDIVATKALIGSKSVLVMQKTCLDPASYGMADKGYDIHPYTRSLSLIHI